MALSEERGGHPARKELLMTTDKIIMIVSIMLNVGIFAWGLYNKTKGNAAAAASSLIASAEETGLLGPEKMSLVVDRLYDMIPASFRTVLNKQTLQILAQKIFDYMKKYANAYIKSKQGEPVENPYQQTNEELAHDLIEGLSSLSLVGLKSFASSFGIETSGMSQQQIIEALVLLLVNRKDN